MKDVTKEKEWEKKQKRAKINAVQMADKLAEEQLRIVHEIASLLGETAADTKVAVEDLKANLTVQSRCFFIFPINLSSLSGHSSYTPGSKIHNRA